MKCEYGCGQEGKFTLKNGKVCCSKSPNSCPKNREKNSKGVSKAHKDGIMKEFTDEDRKKSNEKKIKEAIKKAFTKNSSYSNEFIKPRFIEMIDDYRCAICGINEWQGKPIVLELDHINGNNTDNRFENLRLLCPNCHSQTDTFRGRNKNNGLKKVSDEQFLDALKNTKNIRQALKKVGLSPSGANYKRANKLLKKLNKNIYVALV